MGYIIYSQLKPQEKGTNIVLDLRTCGLLLYNMQ